MDYKVFSTKHDVIAKARDLITPEFRSEIEVLMKNNPGWKEKADVSVTLPDEVNPEGCVILMDCSGSMRGEAMFRQMRAVRALGDELNERGVPFHVLGHTTTSWKGGEPRNEWREAGRPQNPGRLNALLHVVFHEPGMDWAESRNDLDVLLKSNLPKENIDGEALQWAASRSPNANIIYLTDGVPMDDATAHANGVDFLIDHRNEVVETLLGTGRTLTTVFIDNDIRPLKTQFMSGYVKEAPVSVVGTFGLGLDEAISEATKTFPESLMSKPFFAAEPIRRYLLWAGADKDDAEMIFSGDYDKPQDYMPTNLSTGERYSVTDFINDIGKFGAELPKGGKDFHWATKGLDPYKTHDNHDDAVKTSWRTSGEDQVFIGLTGERGVGKTTLVNELVENGFTRVHPFNPGKALLRGYYVSRGATEQEALSMTDGDLKDLPAPRDVLPVDPETGVNYTSRFLMEKLGRFMAKNLGLSTTIGTELRHWAAAGDKKVLIDSVVYEADEIRKMPNSAILSIVVPEEKRRNTGISADITDAHVRQITPDAYVVNDMNGTGPLMKNFETALRSIGIDVKLDEENDDFSI